MTVYNHVGALSCFVLIHLDMSLVVPFKDIVISLALITPVFYFLIYFRKTCLVDRIVTGSFASQECCRFSFQFAQSLFDMVRPGLAISKVSEILEHHLYSPRLIMLCVKPNRFACVTYLSYISVSFSL